MELMFFKLLKEAFKESKKKYEEEKRKEHFLNKSVDYQYLEELVQKINENPLLRISVHLADGTRLELNTRPKKDTVDYMDITEPHEDYLEVR